MNLESITAIIIALSCLGILIACTVINIVDIYKDYKRIKRNQKMYDKHIEFTESMLDEST